MIPLFELGSVHHEFYLINIKLSESNLIESLKYKESTSENHYLVKELPEVRLMITVSSFKSDKELIVPVWSTCLFQVHLSIGRLHQTLVDHEVYPAAILADHNLLVLEPYHETGETGKPVGENALLCQPCLHDSEL